MIGHVLIRIQDFSRFSVTRVLRMAFLFRKEFISCWSYTRYLYIWHGILSSSYQLTQSLVADCRRISNSHDDEHRHPDRQQNVDGQLLGGVCIRMHMSFRSADFMRTQFVRILYSYICGMSLHFRPFVRVHFEKKTFKGFHII